MSAKNVYLLLGLCSILTQSIMARTDYRPATSKGTNHSYFKKGKISIINSSHQDIAWMDSIGACEIWRDVNMITPSLQIMEDNPKFCFTVESAMYLGRKMLKKVLPGCDFIYAYHQVVRNDRRRHGSNDNFSIQH